jgi:hypothetical protein
MDMRKLFLGLSLASTVTACAAGGGENEPAPELKVISPERGTFQSGLADVEVRGHVAPAPDLGDGPGLPVAGTPLTSTDATVEVDGSFTALVPIGAGATMLHTIATDTQGHEATDTRTIAAGNLVPLSTTINDGLTAAISDDAFAVIGEVAGTLIAQQDLGAMVQSMNPVVDSGDGPDCLYAQAWIRDLDLSRANIHLIPYQGGITLQAEIFDLDVPLGTNYAVACLDGSTDARILADRVWISGDLDITVTGGQLDVALMNPTVDIDNLDIQASGIPGTIIDMLSLDSAIEWIVPYAVDLFVGPMINDAIGGLAATGPINLDVAGKNLEMTMTPSAIDFTPDGGKIRLDSRFLVAGSEAAPGFIYTPNGLPSMNAGDGFELAMADDAVNQLTTGFWATGAMNMEIPHQAGQFDHLKIEARLPPLMSASQADQTMKLVIGDLMVTLVAQGVDEAKLAYNVSISLKIDGDGNILKLSLDPPEIQIDTTDEIPNITNLTDDDLEAIHQSVIETMMDQMLPLIGAIPIPTLAGVQLTDVDVNGQNGYVTVTGALEN